MLNFQRVCMFLLSSSTIIATVTALTSITPPPPPPSISRNQATIRTGNDLTGSYRMVALDLDGTLLPSSHVPSDRTCEYLRKLDDQGFTIVIATGRAASTVFDTVKKLNLSNPIHVVCSNGARGIVCSVDQEAGSISYKELFLTTVPESVTQKIIKLSNDLGYVSQYYMEQDIYADPRMDHHYDLTERYIKLTGSKTIYVNDNFEQALQSGPASKQLVLCREEEHDEMIASFEKELSGDCAASLIRGISATTIEEHMIWYLEILHPDVNKGYGLQRICDYLQIPLQEIIAFGDGDNDYEFIQMAGMGIVMKNGRDIVKEVADEVIDFTNDEDGVRKTLQRIEKDGLLNLSKA